LCQLRDRLILKELDEDGNNAVVIKPAGGRLKPSSVLRLLEDGQKLKYFILEQSSCYKLLL